MGFYGSMWCSKMFWTQDSDPCVFPQWKFLHGSPSIPLTGALGPNLRFPSYYPIQKSQRNCNSIQVSPYLGQSWASLLLFIRCDFGDSLIYGIAIVWISGPISDQKCLLSCPSNLPKSSSHSLPVAIFFSHFPHLSQATAIKIQAMNPIQSQCFRTIFNDKYWLVY